MIMGFGTRDLKYWVLGPSGLDALFVSSEPGGGVAVAAKRAFGARLVAWRSPFQGLWQL